MKEIIAIIQKSTGADYYPASMVAEGLRQTAQVLLLCDWRTDQTQRVLETAAFYHINGIRYGLSRERISREQAQAIAHDIIAYEKDAINTLRTSKENA